MKKKQTSGEHAPVVRKWVMCLSLLLSAGAICFTGVQTMLLRRSIAEQAVQSRLSRNAVVAQTWQGLQEEGNKISLVFVEKPHLRPYFYDSKPTDTNDPNYQAVMALCELHIDFFDAFQDDYVFELPGMAKNGKYRVLWERYFRDTFASSPAMCSFATEMADWYSNSTDFAMYMPGSNPREQGTSNGVVLIGTQAGHQTHIPGVEHKGD